MNGGADGPTGIRCNCGLGQQSAQESRENVPASPLGEPRVSRQIPPRLFPGASGQGRVSLQHHPGTGETRAQGFQRLTAFGLDSFRMGSQQPRRLPRMRGDDPDGWVFHRTGRQVVECAGINDHRCGG